MSITSVVTSAPSRGFATVAELKARVDTGTTADEILLQDIEALSLRFEALASRVMAQERVIETIYGEADYAILVLSRRPIVTVHSVMVGDTTLEAADWRLDEPNAGMLRLEVGRGGVWPRGDETPGLSVQARSTRYTVEYTGGYVLPGWDEGTYGAVTLPLDVRLAVTNAFKTQAENPAMLAGITAERLGDYSRSYGGSGATSGTSGASTGDLPPSFLDVARRYANVL